MTDGPMGIQVAPITEDEMNLVQNILKRAVDAAVGLSQLQADVQTLRNAVAGLQADTERLRNANLALDEALTKVRNERDLAEAELVDLKSKAGDAATLRAENDSLRSELAQAKRERDDYGNQTLDLEDALKHANAKLDTIRKAMQQEPFTPTKPETVPTPPIPDDVDYYRPYHWDDKLNRYVNDAPL